MIKNSIFFLVALLLISPSFSQDKIDSLSNLLTQELADTTKINVYMKLISAVGGKDLNQALSYAEQMDTFAEKANNSIWTIKAKLKYEAVLRALGQYDKAKVILRKVKELCVAEQHNFYLQQTFYELGVIEKSIGSSDSALYYLQAAIHLDSIGQNHAVTARSYNSSGGVYERAGKFDRAEEYYLQGIQIAKKYSVKSTEAFAYMAIGVMYMQKKESEKGRTFLEQALPIFESLGKMNLVSRTKMNLGVLEMDLHNYTKAEELLTESLSKFKERNSVFDIINNLQLLGATLNKAGKYNRAEKILEEGQILVLSSGAERQIVAMQLNLAHSYFLLAKYDKALGLIDSTLQINREGQNALVMSKNLIKLKYEVLEAKQDYKAALVALSEFKLLDDSLKQMSDEERFSQLAIKYELEKKEQQIENQERSLKEEKDFNKLLYLGLTLLAILLTVIVLSYRSKRKDNQLLSERNAQIEEQAEKLKALDAIKTKFFNNVAHELRTPLTLMGGHLESTLNGRFGNLNENQRKSILVAKDNANSLTNLVTELLDLGKLDAGNMKLKETEIALKPFLNRIFFTFESLANQFDISMTFDFELAENLGLVADSSKIEKILNNLIHNAIKFTNRGGEISLKAYISDNALCIMVKDNGRGISKEEQTKVFERYFQTEVKETPAQGGTGIGLSLVKELLTLHDGKVSLKSQLNQGSSFLVEFPMSRIIEVDSYEQEEFQGIVGPSYPILEKQDLRILVIDDHKQMQQYLSEIIGTYAKVYIANDGVEALDILAKNEIHLITVDLMMPNMDGIKFLRHLKEKPDYSDVPTIMLTARTTEQDKLEALQIGVDDYITKPFSQSELIARIANLINNRSIRKEENAGEDIENQFLEKLRSLIDENIGNSAFTVRELAKEMGYSEKQLTRIVKKASGLTPLKFIREVRLLYIEGLLKSDKFHTVAEASYAIGIDNPSYFTKIFTHRFGKNPSEYIM